jgi:single-stranded-DNA-specific exonuclease
VDAFANDDPGREEPSAAHAQGGALDVTLVRRARGPAVDALIDAGVDPVLARVYASRGIVAVDELDCALASLPSHEGLKGIGEAAERLVHAIAKRERIVIVADYDADGATACAVGMLGLAALGADVGFIVPNRFEFGYGLTPEIVALAARREPQLIVTVDNGIASVEGVAAAAALGIDVLVTDHHLPGERLPSPAIIVNPNQPGCPFPSKHIAGVAVMFYVVAATRAALRARGRLAGDAPNLAALLDLVALGTVADVVPLDRPNRILVEQGLRRIRAGVARPGIAALFDVARRDASRASTYDLGFVAGPRLNAAGRLADMSIGIRCLLESDAVKAVELAALLDRLNRERREVEARMQDEALADLEAAAADVGDSDAFTLCVHRPDWHQGVVGIVASRLKDRFHRPAIVFARGASGELKGSGRSIAGFHLRDALDLVAKREPGCIARFGGHAAAAGLSIAERDLARFADAFERVARERLTPAELERTFESDGALAPGELSIELARRIRDGVWGQGFAAPAFDDTFGVVDQRVVGERHRKLVLARGGERFEAMAFGQADPLPPAIRAAYRPDVNRWQGLDSLQLILLHWWPAPG